MVMVSWRFLAVKEVRLKGEDFSAHAYKRSSYLDTFWHVLDVWWQKPHAVNKRLAGAVNVEPQDAPEEFLLQIPPCYGQNPRYSSVRRLVPKRSALHSSSESELNIRGECFLLWNVGQLLVVCRRRACLCASDEERMESAYFPIPAQRSSVGEVLPSPHLTSAYKLALNWGESPSVSLWVDGEAANFERDGEWLAKQLLPRIVSWFASADPSLQIKETLRLVELDSYSKCYERLKNAHGQKLVASWPEKTDPSKFVYEDLAIAAYLLVCSCSRRSDC